MPAIPERRAVIAWAGLGLAALLFLPWHRLPHDVAFPPLPGGLVADAETASALWQALLFRRPGLLLGLAAVLAVGAAGAFASARHCARVATLGGFGGAVWLLVYGSLETSPTLALGWGALVAITALLVLGAIGVARTRSFFHGDPFASTAFVLAVAALLMFVGYPLGRGLAAAFLDEQQGLNPLALATRLGSSRLWSLACVHRPAPCGVAWNTLFLALLTATGTTLLGGLLAFAELRSGWRLARVLRILAPLPFVAPSFVAALALILMLGQSGVVSHLVEALFGVSPGRWLYGLPGLWLAQMLAFTPVTYLILRGALAETAQAMEEAARTLGASGLSALRRVTLPLLAPSLAHAFLVAFLESVGDLGSPIIIGGSYAVLSTEIFFSIVGAQFADSGHAAALALVLGLFTVLAFGVQRALLRRRDYTATHVRAGAVAQPLLLPSGARRAVLAAAVPWMVLTLGLYACALSAAFVEVWGRDLRPTLRHLDQVFGVAVHGGRWELTGAGWPSLLTSLQLAGLAAPLTAGSGMLLAWLMQRHRMPGQEVLELSTLLALAIPGTVLGLSYILTFGQPPVQLTGTRELIVMCLLFRSLPVAVGMGVAALRQADPAVEETSRMLGAGGARTFLSVTWPTLRGAFAGALTYSFVRGMTTVSAVVFLVGAETDLATTYIIFRAGQGEYGLAFAYAAVLVLLLSLCMATVGRLAGRGTRLVRPAPAARLTDARA